MLCEPARQRAQTAWPGVLGVLLFSLVENVGGVSPLAVLRCSEFIQLLSAGAGEICSAVQDEVSESIFTLIEWKCFLVTHFMQYYEDRRVQWNSSVLPIQNQFL